MYGGNVAICVEQYLVKNGNNPGVKFRDPKCQRHEKNRGKYYHRMHLGEVYLRYIKRDKVLGKRNFYEKYGNTVSRARKACKVEYFKHLNTGIISGWE